MRTIRTRAPRTSSSTGHRCGYWRPAQRSSTASTTAGSRAVCAPRVPRTVSAGRPERAPISPPLKLFSRRQRCSSTRHVDHDDYYRFRATFSIIVRFLSTAFILHLYKYVTGWTDLMGRGEEENYFHSIYLCMPLYRFSRKPNTKYTLQHSRVLNRLKIIFAVHTRDT